MVSDKTVASITRIDGLFPAFNQFASPFPIFKIMCVSTKSESQSQSKAKPTTMVYPDDSGILRPSDSQTLRHKLGDA